MCCTGYGAGAFLNQRQFYGSLADIRPDFRACACLAHECSGILAEIDVGSQGQVHLLSDVAARGRAGKRIAARMATPITATTSTSNRAMPVDGKPRENAT